jgi:hypothetical protein
MNASVLLPATTNMTPGTWRWRSVGPRTVASGGVLSETIELFATQAPSIATMGLGTERVVLGCTQIVRLRTPLVMAQTLAALDELTGGRMMLARRDAPTRTPTTRASAGRSRPVPDEWVVPMAAAHGGRSPTTVST